MNISLLFMYNNNMNQILKTPNNSIKKTNNTNVELITNNRKKGFVVFLKGYFFLSMLVFFCALTYYINRLYNINKNEKLSKQLLNNYDVSLLYADGSSPDIPLNLDNTDKFSIIGLLEIKKINVKYPILSDATEYLLQISPCRFYGPSPNISGNLCIAAHNYDDGKFFSNLFKLTIGDIIEIKDPLGNTVYYSIYDKYETTHNDIACTTQDTNGYREITLVTCNNLNGNRLIIKAKEQEYFF